jgi:hypothetical protein
MLTKKDLQQIQEYGLPINNLVFQMETFKRGIPFTEVVTAASVGNGIEVISEVNQQMLVDLFEDNRNTLEIVKFVPASGAATRMFRFMYSFLSDYKPEEVKLNRYLKDGDHMELETFFGSLKEFAFTNNLRKKIRKNYPNYKKSTKGMRSYIIVKTMLESEGLNFGKLPKGLIPFHKYTKYFTTAFEEQLYEAAHYAKVKNEAFLHFTFSESHVPYFKKEFDAVKKRVSKKTKTLFNISYSFQKRETDTIAVDQFNEPFRNDQGDLVFRPSGHGALIDNLNDINADIIFIKNIDNVVVEEYVEMISTHKKLLAGKLIWLQQKTFDYIKKLMRDGIHDDLQKEVTSFLWNELNIKEIPDDLDEIVNILNRPLRVCGIVKNTGAPGGGPFWVKNKAGEISLQIVELSQIDSSDPHQQVIINEATHFNPVDLVCGVRNYKGEKFDLSKFVDPLTGFISLKSQNGKPLKAMELPGLWNGAMADWNTVLVEVPLGTFNPVKTVNDLLHKEHRPDA